MADVGLDFDAWLNVKLKDLNTDEGVFGSYIKGILEEDDSMEDKTEALEGILSEIIASNDISGHCREILERWQSAMTARAASRVAPAGPAEMGAALARLMETQAVPAQTQRARHTDEERKIRDAILAQYSQMSDDEDGEGAGGGGGGGGSCPGDGGGLERNTNAAVVAQAEREKREQAKVNSRQKKDKDREDREKQKALAAEKKEKRKTQKGERRR